MKAVRRATLDPIVRLFGQSLANQGRTSNSLLAHEQNACRGFCDLQTIGRTFQHKQRG